MKRTHRLSMLLSAFLVLVCVAPFVYIFLMSLQDTGGKFTLDAYYRVFLSSPRYLLRFWKSLLLCLCIAAGQMVVSALAGYGFAKCRFPGRNMLFFCLLILMILPLQVTLIPNYIMLDDMKLLDTYYALALPSIFLPLGTFIMAQSFKTVPNDVIEAARLDGCGTLGVLTRIALPLSKSGLVCTMLLSVLDGWNMVEQPTVYIKSFERYPIAVALASVRPSEAAVQMVCCVLVTLPPMALFAMFMKELVEGIVVVREV